MTVLRFAQPAGAGSRHRTSPDGDALGRFAEACHVAAVAALADAEPSSRYRAIGLLCGHLAVLRQVVWPAASQRLGRGHWLPATLRTEARQAERALRLLECQLAGESHAARLPMEAVTEALTLRLETYRIVERVLLAWVAEHIPAAEHARLGERYCTLLTSAPTRPHPHGPRTRWLASLAFRFHGCFDRVLDAADSRPRLPRECRGCRANPADSPPRDAGASGDHGIVAG